MKEKSNRKERTILSLSITIEDKKILKMMAAEKNLTIASLIHEWIQDHREEVKE